MNKAVNARIRIELLVTIAVINFLLSGMVQQLSTPHLYMPRFWRLFSWLSFSLEFVDADSGLASVIARLKQTFIQMRIKFFSALFVSFNLVSK